ncbi:NAD(P)/FAD-dependent oxidoreductase [Hydrogenophaga sp.]|uniref:NAD(P)/FAD-dependent oxidoreductase n=1 Tax=Hydrogenophaga sp. TaxID=1904254 RepID=UPI0027307519|nr:NAD(P)/FAD-dependent oxidoreductase [Hydrogenophaga sp.]MDP2018894.1 NAD(P)/FAD-dependent oxidoreductase [Hydrogenophaga sp.]MDP3167721.1 NAD(P)/FAD-dependent oxidoreductase [Hydrogenophaga sp.]MDP3813027.1 NAD(P)/FAD-dependent oxidoreductase [Hydrogenophaga sp.]
MERIDFAIIGGSYAGLSAALQLARARRDVLMVDAGQRRNRFVDEAGETSHGFLSQDGRAPGEIAADAKRQLMRYATVRWMDGVAEQARVQSDGRLAFHVGNVEISAARLILATGVRDELPPLPGLAERWGRSVFHCPYCHGYEMDAGRIGIVATSPLAHHQAVMLPDWGATTLFLNGAYSPNEDELTVLARRGTQLERTPIERIEGLADVVLKDGRKLPMNGLFTQPRTAMSSPLAEQLGCAMDEGPMGPFIKTGEAQATSIPNVFACGDAARAAGNVALAVADGVMAALGAHRASMV